MAEIVNHYSFLLFVVPVVLLILFFLLRGKGSRLKQALAILLLVLVSAGYFLAQPGSNQVTANQAESQLDAPGKPVLLEVYSDY